MSKKLVPILDVDTGRMTPVDYMLPPSGNDVDWKSAAGWQPDDELHRIFESDQLPVVEEMDPVFVPERLKAGFGLLRMSGIEAR
jgi:hypothetical protein